jgi:hypothetical protein
MLYATVDGHKQNQPLLPLSQAAQQTKASEPRYTPPRSPAPSARREHHSESPFDE